MSDDIKSRKVLCLENLKRRILTLDIAPGSHLDETRLADRYEISRPPLREILRELAGNGHVVLHENRGAQVAPMTHTTLRNFFVAAPMIYAAVARLAAENATPEQIVALKDTQSRFREAIHQGDAAERALVNEQFHAVMGDMADNEYLTPSLRRLLIDHTRISMTFYNPRIPDLAQERVTAADQHDEFIALIEAGDGNGAADLAIAHWELSRSAIESFVNPPAMNYPLGRSPDPSRKEKVS